MNDEPPIEELWKDYLRHMSWYVPTILKLEEEWEKIKKAARSSGESAIMEEN